MSASETNAPSLTIGRLSEQSGVPPKTIRYYEEVGLLPEPDRSDSGYRLYDERAVHILRFVGRARELGFAMSDVQELLTLWDDKQRKSSQVKAIAEAQLRAIEARMTKLQGMQTTLQRLIHGCHGDDRPDCPILDELSSKDRIMSTYKIEGMTCEGCVNSITKALQTALPGTEVVVTLEPPLIRVEGPHEAQAVAQCVESAGFDYGGPTS